MTRIRGRVWHTLAAFLEDVRKGDTPTALEEARAIAKGNPKKEKVRLKRAEDRAALLDFREEQAKARLTGYQYLLRVKYAAERAVRREKVAAGLRLAGINAAFVVHDLMCHHSEGWTLMLGMPSAQVMSVLSCTMLQDLGMHGSVSAELRRLQRAIGMSTWEIITRHNQLVGSLGATSTLDECLAEEGEDEA